MLSAGWRGCRARTGPRTGGSAGAGAAGRSGGCRRQRHHHSRQASAAEARAVAATGGCPGCSCSFLPRFGCFANVVGSYYSESLLITVGRLYVSSSLTGYSLTIKLN